MGATSNYFDFWQELRNKVTANMKDYLSLLHVTKRNTS